MSLPLTTVPSGMVKLPVSKQEIRVRAMNIREEKILLTAKDAGNTDDILFAINNLVKECTYGKIDFDKLTIPDITALFIKIIELSKGTTCIHRYICHNTIKDENNNEKECGTSIDVVVDLKEIKFSGGEESPNIKIQDDIIVNLKYPTTEIYKSAFEDSTKNNEVNNVEAQLRIYAYCIASVIQGDTIYTEYTREEIYNWLLNMNENVLEKFINFFNDIPSASLTYEVKCPKCGYKEDITLTGLDDFFTQDIPGNH